MKLYKVNRYYREGTIDKTPLLYYMIFRRSLSTWFRWKWYRTVYSDYWFLKTMKGKKFKIINHIWKDDKWEVEK